MSEIFDAVSLGIRAYDNRNFMRAFQHLYPAARELQPSLDCDAPQAQTREAAKIAFKLLTILGDVYPEAQHRAANALLTGYNGVSQSWIEGEKALRKAAEKNYPPAQADLGALLGERGRLNEAEKWLRLAGTQRAADYRERRLIPKLMAHLEKPANAGDANAQYRLGILFAERQQPIHAYKWLSLAGTPEAIGYRDEMLPNMTPIQVAAGKKLVTDYLNRALPPRKRPVHKRTPDIGG
jgi:TPR repeat protein